MTVLVTGGCGYIGAHVVHALHQAGEKVVVVDDLSYGKPTRIEGSRLYGMDIAAPGAGERLAEIMKAEGVDSVIHFAARKQVGESVEKPLWYYQQNLNGMLNVLIGMRDSGAKKLVFSSSAATYGVPPVDVVPEDVRCCRSTRTARPSCSASGWPAPARNRMASASAACVTSTWPAAARWNLRIRPS